VQVSWHRLEDNHTPEDKKIIHLNEEADLLLKFTDHDGELRVGSSNVTRLGDQLCMYIIKEI